MTDSPDSKKKEEEASSASSSPTENQSVGGDKTVETPTATPKASASPTSAAEKPKEKSAEKPKEEPAKREEAKQEAPPAPEPAPSASEQQAPPPPPPAGEASEGTQEGEPAGDAKPLTDATLGDRVVAVLIDSLLIMVISIVPVIGWLVGLAYLLTRDALPFLDGQSIGKKAMKLKAVKADTGASLSNDWEATVIRNVLLCVPIVGAVVELVVLLNNETHQRLGDQWAKTRVVVWEE